MQTQADMGIGPVSCENCSVFKKGEGGPEAPGALRLRNKKATASVASSYSQNPPVMKGPWHNQLTQMIAQGWKRRDQYAHQGPPHPYTTGI